jgi:dTDP-4-dehydrorhamnose 3,5-epimerase
VTDSSWRPKDSTRDTATVGADWQPRASLIEGVVLREVRNVPQRSGLLTELFRRDWLDGEADQVFQVLLPAGALSAWHAHEAVTDRLFVSYGSLKIVLYDDREGSPTHGLVNEILCSLYRPRLILVPPKVWHGVQNASKEPAMIVNVPDRAYDYDQPDHWRRPPDTDLIPYRFV